MCFLGEKDLFFCLSVFECVWVCFKRVMCVFGAVLGEKDFLCVFLGVWVCLNVI